MVAASAVQVPLGFKFDPDDNVLVEHYLVRRLRHQPLPIEGFIVEADPLSALPWELLAKYKRGGGGDAFFFAPWRAKSSKGNRQGRTCDGGRCWEGQKGVHGKKRLAGTGEEVAWRRYGLNFHAEGKKGSTGWVIYEYAITAPPELASSPVRAYRIRLNKKRKREDQDSSGDAAAPRRASLDDYTSALQASSLVVVVPDDAYEPLLPVHDAILPPAMGTCGGVAGSAYGAADLANYLELPEDDVSELLQSFNDNDGASSVPEPCSQQSALLLGDGIISPPPPPTRSEWNGALEGAHLDFDMPENIDELLQFFRYDDWALEQF